MPLRTLSTSTQVVRLFFSNIDGTLVSRQSRYGGVMRERFFRVIMFVSRQRELS